MNQDQKSRIGGFVMIFSGALLGYLAIWKPYQEALRGAPQVSLNKSGIALAILFPLLGIILAALGESASEHFKTHFGAQKTKRGYAYAFILGAIGLGTYFFVQHSFEALGYAI